MTDRMTQSTKGTFKKQWHKDSTVTLISLHKLILQFSTKSSGKTTKKIISGRNLSNVDTQQWYAYKKIL